MPQRTGRLIRTMLVTAGTFVGISGPSLVRAADPVAPPTSRPSVANPTTAPAPVDPAAASRAGIIRFLEDRVRRDPDDMPALNRLGGEYLARFRDAGDDADLARALAVADQSLKAVPAVVNSGGLAGRSQAAFALHRFAAARDDAAKLVAQESDRKYPLRLLGDALLELGDVDQAADAYVKMAKIDEGEGTDPDPGDEGRQARLAYVRGDAAAARKHWDAAVNLARAAAPPQPTALAWALVQRGQLAFMSGDWDAAERDYRNALSVRPDDWPAVDHVAELRAAQGKFDEAISLYTRLVERVPRPELFQAMGDVYAAAGKADDAKSWHRRALAGYLKAADAGNGHYYHHLAGYYCDVEADGPKAVAWARKDLDVRHTVYACDAMAWAAYQAGDDKAAAEAADKALALGTKDAHLLYHASLIYARAAQPQKAHDCLKRAAEANPKFNTFHVHR